LKNNNKKARSPHLLAHQQVDPQTGKLRPEMILACNSLLRDLSHPSEYICGSTLRLFCRIREPEIVEPLVAAVR
jgi:coatomer subunit beta